ncbi:hypothetical protein PIB30_113017, partial [Stylosanthes scabra]|nr:hypothetical protein [Stylosanthes scabra]
MIDVEKGEVILRVHDEHITFHIFKGIQTTSVQAIKEEHKPPPKSSKTPPMIKASKKPKEIHESKTKGWEYKKIHPEGFTHGQKVLEIQPPLKET